jgi:hypothetical protein
MANLPPANPYDDQDQSEVFDEDNVEGIDAAQEGSTFEEIPDVFDATQKAGDGALDLGELDAAFFDEDLVDDEDLIEEDEVIDEDVYDETDEEDVADPDLIDKIVARGRDEVDLEYQPDVEGRRGARAGAGGFEARGELDESHLEELGYAGAEKAEEETERGKRRPVRRRVRASNAPKTSEVRMAAQEEEYARPAEPIAENVSFDQMSVRLRPGEDRQEALIDEAVEETFPASDPISPKHIT